MTKSLKKDVLYKTQMQQLDTVLVPDTLQSGGREDEISVPDLRSKMLDACLRPRSRIDMGN